MHCICTGGWWNSPRFLYLLFLSLVPVTLLMAAVVLLFGWTVLALCLAVLGLAAAALWQRGRAADSGSLLATTLTATGLAILAGTQVIYLKDFLSGSDYYRMNTLFKFFSQVWVIWGVAAAVAAPRLFAYFFPAAAGTADGAAVGTAARMPPGPRVRRLRWVWTPAFALLLAASLAYPILGTPVRVDQRLLGWRPPLGTLNGLDFMREGTYAWPDFNNVFELRYDWEAIQWLLRSVRGNAVIAESSEVDYYRAFGTRISSATGLSGLKGMHEQEQRYPEDVGFRDGLHRELWSTIDPNRVRQLLDELQVDLIYVGQLEQRLHPDTVGTLADMAARG